VTHAAEWGHWYSRTGEPVYEMPYADKRPGTRPVTLRDARKLGLVPGVSGISRCAAAPALERWKVEQAILAALTLPAIAGESGDAYVARVKQDSEEQAKQAAERGKNIHAAIQTVLEDGVTTEGFLPYTQAANGKLLEWSGLPHMEWRAEVPFACQLGFGGKADLRDRSGRFLADVKTKEFTKAQLDAGKQLAWDDHCIQLAAYRNGLGMPKARCANVFVSVNEPGLAIVHEWKEEELERGWRMFLALLQYWQAKNKYNSSWIPERVAA
jgi:hypothetical protein